MVDAGALAAWHVRSRDGSLSLASESVWETSKTRASPWNMLIRLNGPLGFYVTIVATTSTSNLRNLDLTYYKLLEESVSL